MKPNKKVVIKHHYYKVIPLALILLIVPCIVYLKSKVISGVALDFSETGENYFDFFSYYKSIWLMVFAAVSVVICLFYIKSKKIKLELGKVFIPLAVYYTFVLLSSGLSKYHDQAFWGFNYRSEGFFVITCYVLICFIAALLVTYEKDIKVLFGAIGICGFVLGIIGISQFWGFDIIQTDFGKRLILSSENYILKDALTFNFPKQYIYSTLFNPNYVGSFFAMLLPISITFAIFSKKLSSKIISCIFSCISFINLIGSLSTTGYISCGFSVVLLIVLLNKKFFMEWRTVLILIVTFTVLLIWMNNVSNGQILPGLKSTSTKVALAQTTQLQSVQKVDKVHSKASETEILQLQTSQSHKLKPQALELQTSQSQGQLEALKLGDGSTSNTSSIDQSSPKAITDFGIDKNILKIYANSNLLNITLDTNDGTLSFTDKSGRIINYVNIGDDSSKVRLTDPLFQGIVITVNDTLVRVGSFNVSFSFFVSPIEKVFKFFDSKGNPTDISSPESIGFKGYERWGSSRGYIWSRSLPLIKDTLLVGHGPDTFALYFPQNEFNAKFKYMTNAHILVDKPHNMYIQMAINTGVVSLVAFLAFVLWFIISAIKLYIKPKAINTYYIAGISCLTAVVGYLVAGLANDSVIGVSSVFWILLGLGIACNRLYSKSILIPDTPNVQQIKKKK